MSLTQDKDGHVGRQPRAGRQKSEDEERPGGTDEGGSRAGDCLKPVECQEGRLSSPPVRFRESGERGGG